MTDTSQNNLYIPEELIGEVFSYNPEHRENMVNVLDELLHVTNYTTCDNENCEADLYKYCDDCVTTWIVGNEFHFCNEECASYGEWSIRYDIRKSYRMERCRLTYST
jgi:hypothetical protein